MGIVSAKWCFHGIGAKGTKKPYCARGKLDTGATVPVIPEQEAQRLGIPLRILVSKKEIPDRPKDASGNLLNGEWYMLGAMSVRGKKNCYVDPICVFGQKDRSEPIIGVIPLQAVRTTIRLVNPPEKDSFSCEKPSVLKSVGAATSLTHEVARQVALIKKLSR